MTAFAQQERQALCDLFLEVGPDAPTRCEGWRTADLAAHLFVRERRPLAAPGIVLGGPFAKFTEREMAAARRHHGYAGLVAKVRSGPPLCLRPVDELFNLLEYFVHTEDVRRAVPGFEPRVAPELDEALWGALRRASRMFTRKLHGAGLELERPGGERIVASSATPRAVLLGNPQELALFLYGRGEVSSVELSGPPEAQEAVRAADFSL